MVHGEILSLGLGTTPEQILLRIRMSCQTCRCIFLSHVLAINGSIFAMQTTQLRGRLSPHAGKTERLSQRGRVPMNTVLITSTKEGNTTYI